MRIAFPAHGKKRLQALLEEVFDRGIWSLGPTTEAFESAFGSTCGLRCVATCNGGSALLALLNYAGVRDKTVLLPGNTFWATYQAVVLAGGIPAFVDCNATDLCMSVPHFRSMLGGHVGAVVLVHVGGHVAFGVEDIARDCDRYGVPLIEDCAHAHGASFHGCSPGGWGIGGAYSFYATKTMTTGEGGAVCSRHSDVVDYVRRLRNYGKSGGASPVVYDAAIPSLNYRMSEITAALGLAQLACLPEILTWKRSLATRYDALFGQARLTLPCGMESGYYKYIVLDRELREEAGRVYSRADQAYRIAGTDVDLPGCREIARAHRCAPIWYGWNGSDLNDDELEQVLLR